jgi:protein SCO1
MKLKKKTSLLSAIALLILCGCNSKQVNPSLTILGEKKVVAGDTVYHTIQNFKLINQNRDTITNKTISGKICVANFFFATCQSICPKMSSNLVNIQKQFINVDSVLILSHSVNPLHDSVEVLSAYAGTYGAVKNKWHLLTGNKKHIYDLAKTSYLVNALEDDGSAEGFLHSELFLLLDSKGRLRGMYDGTDSLAVIQLTNDIQILRRQ